MKFVMHVQKPEDVEVTLTVTMKVKEWEEIAKEIPSKWPHWKFSGAIREAVNQIAAVVRVEDKELAS